MKPNSKSTFGKGSYPIISKGRWWAAFHAKGGTRVHGGAFYVAARNGRLRASETFYDPALPSFRTAFATSFGFVPGDGVLSPMDRVRARAAALSPGFTDWTDDRQWPDDMPEVIGPRNPAVMA